MARRRDAARDQFWRRVIRRQESSGLSIRAFCECEGLTEASFYLWRRALARRERSARKTATTFVPVRVVSEPIADKEPTAIEIVLPGGVVVRLRSGFDAQALRQVLAALVEGRSC